MAAAAEPTRRGGYEKLFTGAIASLKAGSTNDEVMKVYDDWAANYDKETIVLAKYRVPQAMSECMDRAFQKVFPGKAKTQTKIIDAGAGTGLVGMELKKLGYTRIDALDLSQEMLNEAKKKMAYTKCICAPLSDQQIDEIKTGEYCVVMCVGTLLFDVGHVGPSAFDEMNRIVQNGGIICFNIHDDVLHRYQDKMTELMKAGIWEQVTKERIPYMDHTDFPSESNAFVYKVIKA